MNIERITFLVHPFCYAKSLEKPLSWQPEDWRLYQEYELAVAKRWYDAIDALGEKDLVVYHPCYQSDEEKALAARARRRLGERCLTVSGREIHNGGFTREVLAALAPEIAEAFRVRGKYTWYAHDLRIAVFSHNYAQDILSMLQQHGLVLDPGRVALRAMGESFEGCATTWTTMVGVYLGTPARVEMPYELSVPDTRFLLESRFVRRVPMAHDTALYLFVGPEDRPVAHYKRERVELADPSYYSRVMLNPEQLVVQSMKGDNLVSADGEVSRLVPPSLVRRVRDGFAMMVASARGRGGEGPPFYPRESALFISARDMAPDAFFELAQKASIVSESEVDGA